MKKEKVVITHQHIDECGNVFGKAHPVDADHKKKSTKEAHERSIGVKK